MNTNGARTAVRLKISGDVIEKIVELAASETEGVAADGKKLAVHETTFGFAKRLHRPVKVYITNEAAVADISVILEQGYKSVYVAAAVQKKVKSLVQSMVGIPVSKVNVKIIGYRTAKEEK